MLNQELLKKKEALKLKGITVPLAIPPAIKLPFKNEKAGYMITYTHDYAVSMTIRDQLQYLCDSVKIPATSTFNAGYAVRLQLDTVDLVSVNDVACIDALAQIYRDGNL
jgi:hypothetical protein